MITINPLSILVAVCIKFSAWGTPMFDGGGVCVGVRTREEGVVMDHTRDRAGQKHG
jgi:hypothetical protein